VTVDYVLHDRSILLPYVTRWIVTPLERRIPRTVSANGLTLTSVTCAASGFAIALLTTPSHLSLFVVATLFTAYTLLDNLDGPHARAMGTSSPLGEFLDHWLDSLNGLFVFVGSVYALGAPDRRTLAIVALMVASVSLTFWEQRVTGRMYMGRVGTLEGLAMVLALLFTIAALGPAAIRTVTWHGYDGVDLFVLLAVLAGGATIIGPLWRTGRDFGRALFILASVSAFAAWGVLGQAPILAIFTLVALAGPLTGGRLLMGRVVKDEAIGRPSWALSVAASVAVVMALAHFPTFAQTQVAWTLVAVLAAQVLLDFRRGVRLLGQYVRPGELLRLLLA
jgi:phosphatidylglycerophosphate synthase